MRYGQKKPVVDWSDAEREKEENEAATAMEDDEVVKLDKNDIGLRS